MPGASFMTEACFLRLTTVADLKYRLDRRLIRNSRFSPQIYGALDRVRLVRWAMRRPRRLSFADPSAQPQPFFIIGSGRSGNTLMRLMLVEGGEIAIPPESYFIPTLYRRFSVLRGLAWPDLCRLLIADMQDYEGFSFWEVDEEVLLQRLLALPPQRHTLADLLDVLYRVYGEKRSPDMRRWGDKTPKNTGYLQQLDCIFPQAQFIHMVRDGRDVALSYVKAGIYDDAVAAARFWAASVAAAERWGRRWGPRRYLSVRYEDLVTRPKEELQRVCAFLDITYDDRLLDFWKHAADHGDTTQAHHRNLQNPVSPASIGGWRTGLDAATIARLSPIVAPALQRLGYGDDGTGAVPQ